MVIMAAYCSPGVQPRRPRRGEEHEELENPCFFVRLRSFVNFVVDPKSVVGGLLHAVDDDDVDRRVASLQFQPELLLNSSKQSRWGVVRRGP